MVHKDHERNRQKSQLDNTISIDQKDSTNSSLNLEEDDEKHYLDEKQFIALLDKLRLNDDRNFSKRLFTIFCFNKKGKVDYYELFHRIFQF